MTVTGADVVVEAIKHLGVSYVWGGKVASGWDCSGFIKYVLEQLGIERVPDGSFNQYAWCGRSALLKPVDHVRGVAGALVFRENKGNHRIEHVAFTDGMNNTIEARGKLFGTGVWPWRANWTDGALIPGVHYPEKGSRYGQ